MKTKLFSWLVILLMSLAFAGCSKDDGGSEEGSGTNTSIVGTWKYVFSTGYGLMTFNQNGTGVWVEIDEEYEDVEDVFTYVYNADTKVLSITWSEDNDLDTYHVVSISETTAVILDSERKTITLQRVK